MYKLLLILRYLRRKLAPLFAAAAVTLCTAMVIIVISIMGGFLTMMRESAKTLTGEVTVEADLGGFPYYEEMIADFRKLPEVVAATPVIRSYGLIKLQRKLVTDELTTGDVMTVEVVGIDPAGLDSVTGYGKTLYWKTQQAIDKVNSRRPPPDKITPEEKAYYDGVIARNAAIDLHAVGMSMKPPKAFDPAQDHAGVVLGIEVSRFNHRDKQGRYDIDNSTLFQPVTMTVLPLTQKGTFLEPAVRDLIVVNEFKSGLYDIDANRVYVPFALLQKMLKMDQSTEKLVDENGKQIDEIEPARATEIMVRGRDDVPLTVLRDKVAFEVQRFVRLHPEMPFPFVATWEERHHTLLGAVEKEKGLVTFLFAIISVVAVAMIAVIFYMIVLEKTRDIGTLRALGASALGIASIFLGYGLTIGIIGGLLGITMAAAIVLNINEIQDFLGAYSGVAGLIIISAAALGFLSLIIGLFVGWCRERFARTVGLFVVGGAAVGALLATAALFIWRDLAPYLNARYSFVMWNREVYYFDKIPNRLDPVEVTLIFLFAVIFSVLGAVIPALLAGRVNPVESLRYE